MNDSTPGRHSVSASLIIDADPQRLFDIVADPAMHAVIDGSGTVRSTRGGARKLQRGDRFTTNMRLGVPYLISNKVVEYDEPRRIAWAHIGGWRWRFEFEPVDPAEDGTPRTRVTETFDWSPSRARLYVERAGWPGRNRSNMERTLERLGAFVTSTRRPA
jgi:hypothetical protein